MIQTHSIRTALTAFSLLSALSFNPARAAEPGRCEVCEGNSGVLQTVKDGLASEDPGDPVRLEKSEKKKIEKARKELVERLTDKQEAAYETQRRDFWIYGRDYIKVFGRGDNDADRLFKILESPESVEQALKTDKRRDAKLDDPEVKAAIERLKTAHTRIWFRDPEVKSLMHLVYETSDQKKEAKLISALAKKHFEDKARITEMDRVLTSQYLEARSSFLQKHKKTGYSKDDLKNLDISFGLESPVSAIPSDDHYGMNLRELEDLAVKKTEGTDHASVFCQPFPNDPQYLKTDDPLLGSNSDVDPTKNVEPIIPELKEITHQETCDLSQTFESNATEVDSKSKEVIRNCLARAKANPACASGVASISASVRSCADTRMSTNPKFPTNLDLSNARSEAMRSAFSAETKSILGMDAAAEREDESARAAYENSYPDADGKNVLSGTCGPRPPKGYSTEPWMPSSRNFCSKNPNPDSLKECLSLAPSNQRWKCDPAREFKNQKEINDYYAEFRMASLVINYTCKESVAIPGAVKASKVSIGFAEGDPRKRFMESVKCGVFFQCFSPKVHISTYERERGGGGFDFSWLRGSLRERTGSRKDWGSTKCSEF